MSLLICLTDVNPDNDEGHQLRYAIRRKYKNIYIGLNECTPLSKRILFCLYCHCELSRYFH